MENIGVEPTTSYMPCLKIRAESNRTDSETTALNTQKIKPDLILPDYSVTKIDPAFCKKLKAEPATAKEPVILTTTCNKPEEVTEEIMAEDVLPNPLNLRDLVDKVAYWIKKWRSIL